MKAVVVGGGVGGLTCAKKFLSLGIDVMVFDSRVDGIGGVWVPSEIGAVREGKIVEEIPEKYPSVIYDSLRTNLPKEIMQIPGVPFSEGVASFPRHEVVREYLKEFAKPVEEHVYCGWQVDSILKNHRANKWEVNISATSELAREMGETTVVCDFVALATGHFRHPICPNILGMEEHFRGRVVHACSYRDPRPFAGRRVIIVGYGPSGQDISADLRYGGARVMVSVRGSREEEFFPEIEKFLEDGKSVQFVDGRVVEADDVVFCTGYAYNVDEVGPSVEWSEEGWMLWDLEGNASKVVDPPRKKSPSSGSVPLWVEGGKRVRPLFMSLFSALDPTLAIVGLPFGVNPFPLVHVQAEVLGRVWLGEVELPDVESRLGEEEHWSRLFGGCVGRQPRHAHRVGPLQWAYIQYMLDAVSGRGCFDAAWRRFAAHVLSQECPSFERPPDPDTLPPSTLPLSTIPTLPHTTGRTAEDLSHYASPSSPLEIATSLESQHIATTASPILDMRHRIAVDQAIYHNNAKARKQSKDPTRYRNREYRYLIGEWQPSSHQFGDSLLEVFNTQGTPWCVISQKTEL